VRYLCRFCCVINSRAVLPSLVLAAFWLMPCLTNLAMAEDYLPLDTGRQWYYRDDAGNEITLTVVGTQIIADRETVILQFQEINKRRYNTYLSWDSHGRLLLHARESIPGQVVVFEPPLVYFAPKESGDVTGTTVMYDNFRCSGCGTPGTNYLVQLGRENVSVPAADYTTLHVFESNFINDDRWYARDVGLVRFQYPYTTTTFELMTWEDTVVPRTGTWGELKVLYR